MTFTVKVQHENDIRRFKMDDDTCSFDTLSNKISEVKHQPLLLDSLCSDYTYETQFKFPFLSLLYEYLVSTPLLIFELDPRRREVLPTWSDIRTFSVLIISIKQTITVSNSQVLQVLLVAGFACVMVFCTNILT